jgi:D-psicose/D-tagatose/L-ribulose 3-epimerase
MEAARPIDSLLYPNLKKEWSAASMKIGVCGFITGKNADGSEFDFLSAAQAAGFDYVEFPLSTLAGLSADEFARVLARVRAARIPVEACNVIFPGSLRLTGTEVDPAAVRLYLESAFERAAQLGVKVLVFGSAGARGVPQGFPLEAAWMQLIAMLRVAGEVAALNGLTLCIEPLNKAECNIIQTAAEGFTLTKLVDHPRVRLLVDYYHMARDGEDCGIIRTAGAWVQHAHFADPDGRVYPPENKPHFNDFFGALKDIGYAGRVSLEAGFSDFARQAARAQEIMRGLAG